MSHSISRGRRSRLTIRRSRSRICFRFKKWQNQHMLGHGCWKNCCVVRRVYEKARWKCQMTRLLPTVALSIFLNKQYQTIQTSLPTLPTMKIHCSLHHRHHQRYYMSAPPSLDLNWLIMSYKISNTGRQMSPSRLYPMHQCRPGISNVIFPSSKLSSSSSSSC